jgi:hypothetical protein
MLMTIMRRKLSALAERLWARKSKFPAFNRQTSAPPIPPTHDKQLSEYAARARAAGIDRLLFYMTFDCDTDEDAAASLELDPWLHGLGIQVAYAVPGTQLKRAAASYRKLAAGGTEFLNHGHMPHAEWRESRYVPITFYDQLTAEAVVNDIRQGHATVTSVVGRPPRGFRAPHFGSFQKTQQLDLIYRTARELGYVYCSTTLPQMALDQGPVINLGGVYEIPLFGSRSAPTAILDSWTHLEDRVVFRLGGTYFDLFRDTVCFMLDHDLPGVLAYYVDPAHVIGQKPFRDAIEMIAKQRIPSVTAEELVALAQGAAQSNRDLTARLS